MPPHLGVPGSSRVPEGTNPALTKDSKADLLRAHRNHPLLPPGPNQAEIQRAPEGEAPSVTREGSAAPLENLGF